MTNVSNYRYFLRNTDGTPLAWIAPDSWLYFEYTLRVNDISRCQGIFSLTITPELRPFFSVENGEYLDAILEVWKRPRNFTGSVADPPFGLEGEFLIRYERIEQLNDGRSRMTIIGSSPVSLLSRAIIMPGDFGVAEMPPTVTGDISGATAAYPWPLPGSITLTNTPHFDGTPIVAPIVSTSHAMWAMVTWCKNVTNAKALLAVDPGLVAPAIAGVRLHSFQERYKNLLDALQRASALSWFANFYGIPVPPDPPTAEGVDFDVVRSTPGQWDFVTYPGGRGTDRTSTSTVATPVILTPRLNNMLQPVIVVDRTTEKSRITVAGAGQDAARDVIRVLGANDAGSIWNRNDEYIDSRKIDPFAAGIRTAVLDGYWRLKDKGIRREFTMIMRQTDNVRYGADFFLGDLVTADFDGKTDDYQIRQVEIRLSSTGGETIDIELGPLDGSFRKRRELLDQIVDLEGDILRQLIEMGAGT